MQINEQELAEAIETISEGGQALGVSCEDVYRRMMCNEKLMLDTMKAIHGKDGREFDRFFDSFTNYAELLLTEALRAKQEVENGLL